MDHIFDILSQKDFDEPEEINAIKKFVHDEYGQKVGVMARDKDIVIMVNSSALASSLRLRGPEIKRRCQIDKKLVFRIGQ